MKNSVNILNSVKINVIEQKNKDFIKRAEAEDISVIDEIRHLPYEEFMPILEILASKGKIDLVCDENTIKITVKEQIKHFSVNITVNKK